MIQEQLVSSLGRFGSSDRISEELHTFIVIMVMIIIIIIIVSGERVMGESATVCNTGWRFTVR